MRTQRTDQLRAGILQVVSTTVILCVLVVVKLNQDLATVSLESFRAHANSEIERAGAGPLHHSSYATKHSGEPLANMDKGLDTLNADTVWENGSPQNSGWTEGDYSVGTGIVKDNQYGWWQRHLLPQSDYDNAMHGLKSEAAHITGEDDADDPGSDGPAAAAGHSTAASRAAAAAAAGGGPVSYRGPGFGRLSP
jgi:hypothetical protein